MLRHIGSLHVERGEDLLDVLRAVFQAVAELLRDLRVRVQDAPLVPQRGVSKTKVLPYTYGANRCSFLEFDLFRRCPWEALSGDCTGMRRYA